MSNEKPPVAKYKLVVEITGNSHEEIEEELLYLTRGGYLLDVDYYRRDECRVIGGRQTTTLIHQNPSMTPERYDAELSEWFNSRKDKKA